MQVSICMSQVQPMLDWLEALTNGRADEQTLDRMLDSEDYDFEFARYQQRVTRQEFRDYLCTFRRCGRRRLQTSRCGFTIRCGRMRWNIPKSTGRG